MKAVNNEKGIALVTALMFMVILLLIGMAATDTTIMERNIASNETNYKQDFYKADSGVSYSLRFTESDIKNKAKGTVIYSTDPSFELSVYQPLFSSAEDGQSGIAVKRYEVISKGKISSTGNRGVAIVAGVQFPSAKEGMMMGPGNETNYN